MRSANPIATTGWEDTPATFLARLTRDNAGTETAVKQADLSGITVVVTDEDGTTTLTSTAVTVSSSVYDTMQTGTVWTEDSTGYNFKHRVPGTAFPAPGKYRVEYLFTLTGGVTFPAVFSHDVRSLARS
jgi:hypothetical protein